MSRKPGESNEPQAWKKGQAEARKARAVVAGQLSAMIIERDATGDRSLLARRLRQLAEAERGGDGKVIRAAIMEIALAAAQWAVARDLRQRR